MQQIVTVHNPTTHLLRGQGLSRTKCGMPPGEGQKRRGCKHPAHREAILIGRMPLQVTPVTAKTT